MLHGPLPGNARGHFDDDVRRPNPTCGEESPVRKVLYPYRTDPPREKDDPMASSDHYDKITIEQRILNDPTLPGTILRLPTVYGPSDNQHRLFPILKCIYDKRSHILIEASGKIYNVSEEQTYTEA